MTRFPFLATINGRLMLVESKRRVRPLAAADYELLGRAVREAFSGRLAEPAPERAEPRRPRVSSSPAVGPA